MTNAEVYNVVESINQKVRQSPWMDFELKHLENCTLKINGGIDLLKKHEISIVLHDVFFIASPTEWKTETKDNFLFLIEGEEARQLNLHYQVEEGNYIFKFKAEYYPSDFGCYFAARSIEIKDA